MFVTVLGISICFKEKQSPNAHSPMLVIFSERLIFVNELQSPKVYGAISFTPLGIAMLIRLVQL